LKVTAKWSRISPAQVSVPAIKGGIMIMATAAKKHVTLFVRSRHAKGAGLAENKARFADAAKSTLGEPDRMRRNAIVSQKLRGNMVRGIHKKSRARPGSPLRG